MKKLLLVALFTYKQRVRSGTFLLLTFRLPLIIVIGSAIPIFQELGGDLPRVGYVDQTGQLSPISLIDMGEDFLKRHRELVLNAFPTADSALSAADSGQISGYLLVPPDYFEGGRLVYYSDDAPNESLLDVLRRFLRQAMLPDASPDQLALLKDPLQVTYQSLQSGDSFSEGTALVIRIVLPAAMGIIIAFTLYANANLLGQAVVEEKEQRAMEMVITSMRTWQLVAGKVLGIAMLTVTQLIVWCLAAVLAIYLVLTLSSGPSQLAVPWDTLLWAFMLGAPTYLLYAILAAGLGIIAGDKKQAQQLAGNVGIFSMFPLWLTGIIIDTPNNALAVALTLFPLTSPIFAMFRMTLTEVPVYQLFLALGIILLCLLPSTWALTRIFRASMLLYGQRMTWKEVWKALKEAV